MELKDPSGKARWLENIYGYIERESPYGVSLSLHLIYMYKSMLLFLFFFKFTIIKNIYIY